MAGLDWSFDSDYQSCFGRLHLNQITFLPLRRSHRWWSMSLWAHSCGLESSLLRKTLDCYHNLKKNCMPMHSNFFTWIVYSLSRTSYRSYLLYGACSSFSWKFTFSWIDKSLVPTPTSTFICLKSYGSWNELVFIDRQAKHLRWQSRFQEYPQYCITISNSVK